MAGGTVAPPLLRARLGLNDDGLSTGVPVLAGPASELLFPPADFLGTSGLFRVYRHGDWWIGAASVAADHAVEQAALRLYRELFAATRGRHLARVWNYVPAINSVGDDGVENYGRFCRARAMAFEQQHGHRFAAFVPAASAVGTDAPQLTVLFAASAMAPRHIENPLQVPAYEYPREYGPRAPSFARATVVPGAGGDTVFISGTSSIRGHMTIAPDRTAEQLDCTLENLRAISVTAGLGSALGAESHERTFKVYLRRRDDEPAVAAVLNERLLRDADTVTYLRADICRAPLNIEIEATLTPRG